MTKEQAANFLDGASVARGTMSLKERCSATLRELEIHYLCLLPEAEKADFEQVVNLFYADYFGKVTGDVMIAGFIAEKNDDMPPEYPAVFIGIAYSVEAIKAYEAGHIEPAWALAFDAAQWEGFLSGALTHGDPEAVRKKILTAQSFIDARGKRERLPKTEFFIRLKLEHPHLKPKQLAAKIFNDAPAADDGEAPFFYRIRDLIDRQAEEPVDMLQLTGQIQKAIARHGKAKKDT